MKQLCTKILSINVTTNSFTEQQILNCNCVPRMKTSINNSFGGLKDIEDMHDHTTCTQDGPIQVE